MKHAFDSGVFRQVHVSCSLLSSPCCLEYCFIVKLCTNIISIRQTATNSPLPCCYVAFPLFPQINRQASFSVCLSRLRVMKCDISTRWTVPKRTPFFCACPDYLRVIKAAAVVLGRPKVKWRVLEQWSSVEVASDKARSVKSAENGVQRRIVAT
jgi:hypothetical protein